MKLNRVLLLSFIFIIHGLNPISAQSANQNSMLWRITGKGLSRPSYLFGTMHVRNKKAFNFKDSLYYVIENTEGFALESHPDSMSQLITAFIEGKIDAETFEGFDNSERPEINEKELEKIFKRISKDPSFRKLSKKEKYKVLTSKILNEEVDDSLNMDVFMDAYLYRLADQQGKKIFGLEKVEDQIYALTYLSKGLNFSAFIEKGASIDFSKGSPLHHLYYNEELDSVHNFFTTYFADSVLKVFLYDRNVVMAHKMDSLMQLLSMVTAVGAGHLPGEKGVISLLQNMGYIVEPVTSTQKKFAGDYIMNGAIVNRGWIKDSSQLLQFTYEMPGPPVKQIEDSREVRYYYDLRSGLLYMIVSGTITQVSEKDNLEAMFEKQLETYLASVNGKVTEKKSVFVDSLNGFEAMVSTDDAFSRIVELFDNNRFYFLMLTSQRKATLSGEDAEYFINSFHAEPLAQKEWRDTVVNNAGFSVSVPGKMEEKILETESDDVELTQYSVFDPVNNTFYGVYYNKAKPGIELSVLPFLSNTYITSFSNEMGNVDFEKKDTSVSGFPSVYFNSEQNEGRAMRGLIIKRNNSCYLVTAEYDYFRSIHSDLDRFFSSFSLSQFDEKEWKQFHSPGNDFYTIAPNEIKQHNNTDTSVYTSDTIKKIYYSTDMDDAIVFQVEENTINDYYWASNKDSIYNHWKNIYLQNVSVDSLVSFSNVINGGVSGKELIINNKFARSITRYRLLLNGNRMYVLSSDIPAAFRNIQKENLFFDSFRFKNEESSDMIFVRTPEKLFQELQSEDSTIFSKAYSALNEVVFEPSHYELVVMKAMEIYTNNDLYYETVNDKLFHIAQNLLEKNPDLKSVTEELVKRYYFVTENNVSDYGFQLLTLLSKCKARSSYLIIKEFFRGKIPQKKYPYQFYYSLRDSLQLTALLYPEILDHLTDTVSGMQIMALSKHLLDSNVINLETLLLKQKSLLQLASQNLVTIQKEAEEYDYSTDNLVELLGLLKQKETDDMLYKYLSVKQIEIKWSATVQLLRNGKSVSKSSIKKIAENDQFRADVYAELFKLGKLSLFPSEYATQQNMGMSYVYQTALYEDDMESDINVIYIKKIEKEYKGKNSRFFLYRVVFKYDEGEEEEEDETYSYLAVAGPFDIDSKSIILDEKNNLSGLYYIKEFDPYSIDEFFTAYIANLLKEDNSE